MTWYSKLNRTQIISIQSHTTRFPSYCSHIISLDAFYCYEPLLIGDIYRCFCWRYQPPAPSLPVDPIHWIQDRVTVLGYAIGETEALFDKAEVQRRLWNRRGFGVGIRVVPKKVEVNPGRFTLVCTWEYGYTPGKGRIIWTKAINFWFSVVNLQGCFCEKTWKRSVLPSYWGTQKWRNPHGYTSCMDTAYVRESLR